jgi:hypothetical protein
LEIAARFPQASTAIVKSIKGTEDQEHPRLRAGEESDDTQTAYRVAAFQTFLSGRISTFGDNVAVSRGQYDARIYTDDKVKLSRALDRDVSHRSALERTPAQASQKSENRGSSETESVGHSMAVGST